MTEAPLIARLKGREGRRVLLLLALSLLLLVTIVLGLAQLGIATALALGIAIVVIAAQFYALGELRGEEPQANPLVRNGWAVFCAALVLLATATSTLGWWQLIGGPAASLAAGRESDHARLDPQVEAVRGAAEEAVAAVDALSRMTDQLVDVETASGDLCGAAATGAGPSAMLIRQASDRYGALAQSTRRLAASIRSAALSGDAAGGPPQGQVAAIAEAAEKLQRDAQALTDEAARFRDGTPFVDGIANTATRCTNPQLATTLANAATKLTALEQQSARLAQGLGRSDAANPAEPGQAAFGTRFGLFEVLALVIAAIVQLGLFLLAVSAPPRPKVLALEDIAEPEPQLQSGLPQLTDATGAEAKPDGE